MSIITMRNIVARFNRKPSILLIVNNKDVLSSITKSIEHIDIDIRIAIGEYNISIFPISLIITDDVNDQIVNISSALHCPILMVTDNRIESTHSNLYITNLNDIEHNINSLIFQRFILK